ncbi:Secreted and transmembrane protein 1 [Galemys pyrenaicus]|uniref:Secreted and transmembrane protein 1 n=1 Tax=Galemys pyrenaicus TaxID=202257 RepID=A0A8J5ZMS6_GALPY|nr:Secreted and transmembrane protein 1 [Galemys pyrenaicus]
MSCNSSSPFTHINIHLKAPGKAAQLIFRVDAPGTFSSAGWRLVVQGGKAQLVIQDAQPGQAGVYMWNFVGRQRNMKYTQLEVSGEGGPAGHRTPPAFLWGAAGTRSLSCCLRGLEPGYVAQ